MYYIYVNELKLINILHILELFFGNDTVILRTVHICDGLCKIALKIWSFSGEREVEEVQQFQNFIRKGVITAGVISFKVFKPDRSHL